MSFVQLPSGTKIVPVQKVKRVIFNLKAEPCVLRFTMADNVVDVSAVSVIKTVGKANHAFTEFLTGNDKNGTVGIASSDGYLYFNFTVSNPYKHTVTNHIGRCKINTEHRVFLVGDKQTKFKSLC